MYHRQQMRTQRWTLDIGDDVFVHAIGGEYCKGTRVRVTLSRRSTVQYLSQRSPGRSKPLHIWPKINPSQTRPAVQIVLQDAQTRLFFKAQSVIQSEILRLPMTAYISLLVSIVTFVSRTFSETSLAALGALTGYEIRETQSISRLFELRDSTSERHGS